MPCLNMIWVKIPNKNPILVKNVETERRQPVPCGKCAGCMQMKRNSWTFRLLEQEKTAQSSTFLTLTYNNEQIRQSNGVQTLDKKDLQNYFKRVRKTNEKLKYYAVGEYGEKSGRPHYHAIVFNASRTDLRNRWSANGGPIGNVRTDTVTQASIHYVTKYLINNVQFGYTKRLRPFSIMSKGLGLEYTNLCKKYHKDKMEDVVIYAGGTKQKMPRYIKDKIFNPEEQKIISEKNKENLPEISYEEFLGRNKAIRYKSERSSKSNNLK